MEPLSNHPRLPAPVLVVGFSRLAALQRVLAAVAAHHQGPVYIFLDTAREQRPGEAEACARVRSWVSSWVEEHDGAEVRVAETNLGSMRAIPAGIDWVLSLGHSAVMILEDDCVPAPDFFPFMHEMLSRYASDERVILVSGDQFLPPSRQGAFPDSYYFSRFVHTWGWGTWSRAWRHYDATLSSMYDPFVRSNLKSFFRSRSEKDFFTKFWLRQFAQDPRYSSWDLRWQLAVTLQRGLCIHPVKNLVRNIGFGRDATRTKYASSCYVVPLESLSFPLRHPENLMDWSDADRWLFDHLHSKRPFSRLRRLLQRIDPEKVQDRLT